MRGTIKNGIVKIYDKSYIKFDNTTIFSPSDDVFAEYGIYPIIEIKEDGENKLENGIIYKYIGDTDLQEAKNNKILEIESYDTSDNVNAFYYNNNKLWLDKNTRVGVVNAIKAAIALNKKTLTIGIDSYSITLDCETELEMFNKLEMYALECYLTTLNHKNNIKSMNNIKDIETYDITSNYPDKLYFNI